MVIIHLNMPAQPSISLPLKPYTWGFTPCLTPAWIPITPAEIQAQEDYEKDLAEWNKNNDITCQQICWSIPDSLITHLISNSTAAECYETLEDMFKGCSFVVNLKCR
ncbi:hypothetical protein PAXINDRAFT_9035 [Paxillus involutus ATCC 200175]|nr:hypothetical protein PAXINDRAFT_9035 [Paxillus involutus ATCC 200175]